jgi:hypothetical protein
MVGDFQPPGSNDVAGVAQGSNIGVGERALDDG